MQDISDCLSPQAQNVAEARLAAKRAARAEAREIRMKELERQQKEIYQVQKKYYGLDAKWGDIEQWMEDSERYSHRPRRNLQASDEDDLMSVTSKSSLRTNGYEDELLGTSQYRKSSRSSTGSGETVQSSRGPPRDERAYYSDLSLASAPLTSKSQQQSVQNGSRPSLLNCNSLPSRSQRGSLYDEGVSGGSRRSSSSRPTSEYSCHLGSGSRASSRASSARASPVVEERPDKDFGDKSSRPVSSLSAATLASLGGTSSRRGSGDTSASVDTEASIREIKDSLAEVEEKYKRSMVTNAQLDNEKTSSQYQVDMLREVLLELEEELAETRRQYDEKHKECERQKHDQTVLRFQLAEMKEALEQRESLLTKHGIALDSEDTPNGDASLEPHVNSDSRPDPPIRVTSMGQSEDAVEKKATMPVVDEYPPSRKEQDTQEVLQYASSETPLPVEVRDTMKEQSPKENDSNTDCKVEPALRDTGSDSLGHLKAEQPHDTESVSDEKETVNNNVEKMFPEVDTEATINQNDMNPAEGEVFQDALDVVQSPSVSSPLSDEHAFYVGDCKAEDHCNSQQKDSKNKVKRESTEGKMDTENALEIAKYKDHNTADIPADVGDIHAGEEDEHDTSSPDSSSKYESGDSTTDETISTDEEPEKVGEQKVNPEVASIDVESGLQHTEDNPGETNSITSYISDKGSVPADASTESDIYNVEENKIGSTPEQPSQDTPVTKEEKQLMEFVVNKSSKVSESSLLDNSESTFDNKAVKEDKNVGDSHQEQNKDTTDACSLDNVLEGSEEGGKAKNISPNAADTVLLDQGKEDKLYDPLVCSENRNSKDKALVDSETPKTSQSEPFSSEGESAPEGEESDDDDDDDDDDGTVRSEKYTGESLPLGSSVDRSSMDDIRMEDNSDKALKKGKGKNKEDCVVS